MDRPAPERGDALLGLLGLGARGRGLVVGVDATRAALQRGAVPLVVLARDASERAVEKVLRLARAREVMVLPGPNAAAIGTRLGRPPVMAVAVLDRHLARGMRDVMADGS